MENSLIFQTTPAGASVPLVNTIKSNYIQNCNWHERDARASRGNFMLSYLQQK